MYNNSNTFLKLINNLHVMTNIVQRKYGYIY